MIGRFAGVGRATLRVRPIRIALLLLCLGGPIACHGPAHARPEDSAETDPVGAAGTGGEAEPARHEVRATVLRAGLRVAESMPPLYFVDVVSALENGCVRFARADVRREDRVIAIEIWNSRPKEGAGVACTMIYGEKQTAVALGSDFVPGERYTLDVNGERQSFVAQ